MPPKGNKAGKTALKKEEKKIVADKTFGLKNKNKSKKVQQYVNQVAAQAKMKGKSHKDLKAEEEARKQRELAKQAKEEAAKMQAALFKSAAASGKIVQEALAPGQDPKTMLCAYFKAGGCRRGNKCKYSHDLGVERKVDKANLYVDERETDTMDKWDQAKLEEVINKKHIVKANATNIICKFFLDAIEKGKYGWFWKCPNGKDCMYKHRLPLGYVLKKPGDEDKKEDDGVPLEELLEDERAALLADKSRTLTPITPESFAAWKAKKRAQREAAIEKKIEDAKNNKGKSKEGLSGRDLFTFDPTLFVDDDGAADEYEFDENREFDEDNENNKENQDDDNDHDSNPDVGFVSADADTAVAADAVGDASLFTEDVDLPDDDDEDEE